MSAVHAIEKELAKKLKLKPDSEESRQDWLAALAVAVGEADDDLYSSLTVPAQKWADAAVKAYKKKQKIAEFAPDEGGDEAPKKTKAAAKDKDAKEPSKRGKGADGTSGTNWCRGYLVDHPDASVEEVLQAVEKAGFAQPPSKVTVQTVRSEFRGCTRIYRERGYFKQNVNTGTF